MPLSRRYSPEWAPGESGNIGMDFSAVIPPGVGIQSGVLSILLNNANAPVADSDFIKGGFNVSGRTAYLNLSGGINGRDYQLHWQVIDTDGNHINRTALLLCAWTS